MLKRMSSILMVAALSLGAAVAMAAPDIGLFAPPGDLAAGVLMASAVLGAPLAEDAVPVSMRAKFVVTSVTQHGAEPPTSETVAFGAVCKSGAYPADGSDDDNTYARWSPSASCSINIANPALFGKFKPGQKFYVDFTEAADPVLEVATPAG